MPHELVNFFAHLFLEILGAGNAHAVFAAQRSFELQHERSHFVGNLPVFFQILRAVQIQHRPHVQQSRRGVAVIGGIQSEPPHQLLQFGGVGRQVPRPHGRVFDEGHGFGSARATGQKRQSRLAQRPYEFGFVRCLQNALTQAQFAFFQQRQPLVNILEKFDD